MEHLTFVYTCCNCLECIPMKLKFCAASLFVEKTCWLQGLSFTKELILSSCRSCKCKTCWQSSNLISITTINNNNCFIWGRSPLKGNGAVAVVHTNVLWLHAHLPKCNMPRCVTAELAASFCWSWTLDMTCDMQFFKDSFSFSFWTIRWWYLLFCCVQTLLSLLLSFFLKRDKISEVL